MFNNNSYKNNFENRSLYKTINSLSSINDQKYKCKPNRINLSPLVNSPTEHQNKITNHHVLLEIFMNLITIINEFQFIQVCSF